MLDAHFRSVPCPSAVSKISDHDIAGFLTERLSRCRGNIFKPQLALGTSALRTVPPMKRVYLPLTHVITRCDGPRSRFNVLVGRGAKAAQEVAKPTGKAIEAAAGAGTVLVNGTVGKIAAATLGLMGGDWVQAAQVRNLARLKAKTARMLDGIDKARLSEPSPSVVRGLL